MSNELTTGNETLPIFTHLSQSQAAVELRDSANVLVSKAGQFVTPTDDESAKILTEYVAQGKALVKLLESKRREMKAPILERTKELEASFKGPDGPMTALEKAVKQVEAALKPYLVEKQRKQDEKERLEREARERAEREREDARRAEEEAAAAAAAAESEEERRKAQAEVEAARANLDNLSTQVSTPARKTVGAKTTTDRGSSAQLRDNWKYRVVDISQVPENYLVDPEDRVNRTKLNKMAKSMKDDATVPGIEFYNDPIIQSKAS